MTELVLGTAQLGQEYGVTNTTGRLDDPRVAALLTEAVAAGITTFDTAEAYGDAESRLGTLMPASAAARYVTKFSLDPDRPPDVGAMVARSSTRLRAGRLGGVLLHRMADLADPRLPDVLDQLREARDAGRVDRIGVSVYDLDDLERSVDAFPTSTSCSSRAASSTPGCSITRSSRHSRIAGWNARRGASSSRACFSSPPMTSPLVSASSRPSCGCWMSSRASTASTD